MDLTLALADALLDRWPVARLATVGPDGRPHQVPVVFARHAGLLWSPVDAKPKATRELTRLRNVRAHPAVSLILDHYHADWNRLWWLRVDGRAIVKEGLDDDGLRAADALRAKYPQYAEWSLFRGDPQLLRIAIERIRSWCAGPAAEQVAREFVTRSA